MAGEIFYDANTGKMCYLASRFPDPTGTNMFAEGDIGKAMRLGPGTSFWVPMSYVPAVGTPTYLRGHGTYLYQYDGIASSSSSQADKRTASVNWVRGLTTPRRGTADVDPYAQGSGFDRVECYFRNWGTTLAYPVYWIGIRGMATAMLYNGSRSYEAWFNKTLVGCQVKTLRVKVEGDTDGTRVSQPLDATHVLRCVPVWIADVDDETEREALPWRPNALDELPHFDVSAFGTDNHDVSSLDLIQPDGKLLWLICYFPFVMPDNWWNSPEEHIFCCATHCNVVGMEYAIP